MTTRMTRVAETLVTCYNIGHPLSVYAQRLERDQKAAAEEAYGRLKKRETVADSSPVQCGLAWKNSHASRGLRLGVEEFKKNHPRYAAELESAIEYQRAIRRNYVEFGVRPGQEIPDDVYLQVMEEIGIPSNIARSTLNTALKLAAYLEETKGFTEPARMLVG